MNSENIHVLWVTSGHHHSCIVHEFIHYTCILSTYTKAVTLHCAKVRGGKDQGPATQVTHLIGKGGGIVLVGVVCETYT